jgi:hypothetical protein
MYYEKDVEVVSVNGEEKLFKGPIQRIGGGGTKTAYKLLGTDHVVLLPNEVDGQALVDIFERICDEEVYMSTYLKNVGLLGLPVTKCVCNGMFGLYAPSFEFYPSLYRAHVIDKKELLRCTWNPQSRFDGERGEVDWVPVFQALFADLVVASLNGLSLRGDSFNLLLAESGSVFYCGTGRYALRYFGFDYASKRFVLSRPDVGRRTMELEHECCTAETEAKRAMLLAIDIMDCLLGQPIVSDQYKLFVQTFEK